MLHPFMVIRIQLEFFYNLEHLMLLKIAMEIFLRMKQQLKQLNKKFCRWIKIK